MNKKKQQTNLWNLLGNILNLPFGIVEAISWACVGFLWCFTVVGIPFGIQCFKMVQLVIWPFGKQVELKTDRSVYLLLNILWLLFSGLELALLYAVEGIVLCLTIIGIPWGLQKFKMAKLVLLPFGADIK